MWTVYVKSLGRLPLDGRFSCRAKGGGYLRRFAYRRDADAFQAELIQAGGEATILHGQQRLLEAP